MKKFLLPVILGILLCTTSVFADEFVSVDNLTTENYWNKTGKAQEKVYSVANRLIERNQLNKRVPLTIISKNNEVNANANLFYKNITVYSGILLHIDSDDELAFILGHEMAHAMDAYGGPVKYVAMQWNAKSFEMKADLKAIDMMVNAGYDPTAAIVIGNKIFSEPMWDWGFFSTHPKGSKRLLSMYKYIYKKYPQYLTSANTKAAYFKNFEYAYSDELRGFRHKEDVRQQKRAAKEGL